MWLRIQILANFENTVTRLWIIVFSWSYGSYDQSEISLRLNFHLTSLQPKDGQSVKYYHKPLNNFFPLVLRFLWLEQHFEGPTVKFSLSAMTTQKWPICQIPWHASWASPHYDAKDLNIYILKLFSSNPQLVPLRPKRWPNYEAPPHASESSLLASFTVLTSRTTFWNTYSEILT